MAESEREDSEQVDRRAFLRGAGRRSIARATSGGLRGGLMNWAIARAERSADEEEPERDWYLEALDDAEPEAAVEPETSDEDAPADTPDDEEWHGVDLSGGA